ncbi:MAG: hypothetical protein AB1757_13525 [Acidobacteriota bacterium]
MLQKFSISISRIFFKAFGKSGLVSTLSLAIAIFASGQLNTSTAQDKDKSLKAEDLIARHLEAIGKTDARAAIKSRVASGTVRLVTRIGGAVDLPGEVLLASEGARLRLSMKFPSIDYPGENLAFDGKDAATSLLPKGGRSQLSAFFSQQESPLKEGLLGGVLSTAWSLLRVEQLQPKLEYRGMKKVDGRPLHELGYRPRKGAAGLKILLYFNPETFQHVRTIYSFQVGASVGSRENPEQNPETYYSLTEDFDDFRVADGLTLPTKYRLQISAQGGQGARLFDYTMTINGVSHKETLTDKLFTLK